jgi:hypothetical protein
MRQTGNPCIDQGNKRLEEAVKNNSLYQLEQAILQLKNCRSTHIETTSIIPEDWQEYFRAKLNVVFVKSEEDETKRG